MSRTQKKKPKGLLTIGFPFLGRLLGPAISWGRWHWGGPLPNDLSGRNRPNVLFGGFIRESLTPRVAEEFELMNYSPDSRYFSYSLVKYKSL